MSARRSGRGGARLFFALWPDDGVRNTLATAARAAQARTGGRAIGLDKIHLTLFFVGSFDRDRIPMLEAIGASVRATAFDLALETLGYWRHNRIVWCGPTRCPTPLALLAAELSAALEREGLQIDERAYVPHVTLVRDAERAPGAVAFAPCAWRVRDFVLVESVPFGGTVRYAVRARWTL